MRLELYLALRYLRGNRHTLGGSLTSAVSVASVMVGVAALVTTLSVMTGFREDIRKKILGAQPHLVVMGSAGSLPEGDWSRVFQDVPGVEAWSPFIMEQALIRKGSVTQGAVVKGVDPSREPSVTGLHERLKEGRWETLAEAVPGPSGPPVFLGKELARALDAKVGNQVLLAVPAAAQGFFTDLPTLYNLTVAGILETGLYDYDSSLAVISLDAARSAFRKEKRITGLGARLKDPDDSIGAAMRVQKNLGPGAWARSWLALNRNLFSALKLEKVVMFLILTLITLVAAFTILSNLVLVTAQKTREIGILKAMGATPGAIGRVFLIKGLLMGGMGTGLGLALGLTLSLVLKRYQFIQLPADVYYIETLPVTIVPGDVALVAGAAVLIVLAATLYPARLAARLDALSAIRQ